MHGDLDLLDFILGLQEQDNIDWTEADTRAQYIDPVLGLLGWSPGEIKREPYAGWHDDRGYIDYLLLLDDRPMMVIEAKKTGRTFDIPNSLAATRTTTYKKLRATASKDLVEALDQCLQYALYTGAQYASATNGIDWIVFKPSHPFRSLPTAKVVLFKGSEQIAKRIDDFRDLFSPEGVQEGRTEKELLGRDIQSPTHSKRLQDAFPYRGELTLEQEEYSNILNQMLEHYVVELTDEADFRECYIPFKGNGTTSNTLQAIVSSVQSSPNLEIQKSIDFGSDVLTAPTLPNLPSGRTVVLHGGVGVGKTSFLRHCELSLQEDGMLDKAVWVRVDLLPFQDRHFGSDNVSELLDLICKTVQEKVSDSTDALSGRYDPDTWNHLRDIYNSEVRKFQKAKFPESDDSDPEFLAEAREYVWELRGRDSQDHLLRVISWLTINCKLPVIIALDNSDQLGIEFQEFLYKFSETVKSKTSAVLILVVRTEALESHVIREHSIASVQEQFLIEKAPLPAILSRRFRKITDSIPTVLGSDTNKVARDRIAVLMETLESEANLGTEAFQIVEAAGTGSLRDNLRAISAIFRSSPGLMDRLVYQQHQNGKSRLTESHVVRAMIKEDLSNSDSNKLIPNIFSVSGQLTTPYSLGILRILQQVRSRSSRTPVTLSNVLNDFSLAGVDRTIAHQAITKLWAQRLIGVSHMLGELREADVLSLTPLGKAMLDIILSESSYYGLPAFNTYIYDRNVYNNMRSAWTSNAPYYRQKFEAISNQFINMVISDDEVLRKNIDLNLLEPIVGENLPGMLDPDRIA